MAKIYDMFNDLGLVRADNATDVDEKGEAKTLTQSAAQYMEIRLVESNLIAEVKEKIRISLPYNHDKVISDRLEANIKNQWGSSKGGLLGNAINVLAQKASISVGQTAATVTGSQAIGSYISNSALFEYDAGSTKKTLSIPFIVPLAAASKEKLYGGAAKRMRETFNFLQGLLYPKSSGLLMPPLMQVTIGGLYRSFFGFVTGVDITPTNSDMFLDPCTMQYYNMVYDGTITFSNLFMYYHGDGSNPNFDIDTTDKAVLFGDEIVTDAQARARTEYAPGGQFDPKGPGIFGMLYFGLNRDSIRTLYRENSRSIPAPDQTPADPNQYKGKPIPIITNIHMDMDPTIQETIKRAEFTVADGEKKNAAILILNEKNQQAYQKHVLENQSKGILPSLENIRSFKTEVMNNFAAFFEATNSNVPEPPKKVFTDKPRKVMGRELSE